MFRMMTEPNDQIPDDEPPSSLPPKLTVSVKGFADPEVPKAVGELGRSIDVLRERGRDVQPLPDGTAHIDVPYTNVAKDDISVGEPCPLPNHSAIGRTALDVPDNDSSIRADRPDPAGGASHVLGQARSGNRLGCKASACRLGSHHEERTKKGGSAHGIILQSHS
jgi:hypothetical protein